MHNNVSSVSSPLDVAATHHRINVDILTTSAFLRSLPNVGEVVLDTMPQSIISVLAMAAGARIAYLANYSLCQKHGLEYVEASKAAGVQPLCFSTTERDVFIEIWFGFSIFNKCLTLVAKLGKISLCIASLFTSPKL